MRKNETKQNWNQIPNLILFTQIIWIALKQEIEDRKIPRSRKILLNPESEESEIYFLPSEDEVNDIETKHDRNYGVNYDENLEKNFENNYEENFEEYSARPGLGKVLEGY